VITTIPGVLTDPAPRVVYNNFGTSIIDFTVYYRVDLKIGDKFSAIDNTITGINTAFREKSVEMPFPTSIVLLEKQVNS